METENIHIDIELLTRYLAAETDNSENKAVEVWISATDENRKEYENLKNTWDSLEKTNLSQEIDTESEWKYNQILIRQKKPAATFTIETAAPRTGRVLRAEPNMNEIFVVALIGSYVIKSALLPPKDAVIQTPRSN
jgi:hypothetical protein